jgi:hypothetical protein
VETTMYVVVFACANVIFSFNFDIFSTSLLALQLVKHFDETIVGRLMLTIFISP